jgi:DNA-binding XRE family transcriptional regulator
MENKEFSRIRAYLRVTQNQLAGLLCISPKAIQSYEQGWRNIPAYAERQLLLLLFLNRSLYKDNKPCWKILNCPIEWREKCSVWELKNGDFCWFINGTFCHGKNHGSWKKKIKICRQCEVFKPILAPI